MEQAPVGTLDKAAKRDAGWPRVVSMILVCEKIIQHVMVSVALWMDWGGIRSSVAVSPDALMVLGASAAVAFALSLWGLSTHRRWATRLIIGLALFDIIGEFVAQGRISITITVSFIVAIALLIVALRYRQQRRLSEGEQWTS